MRAKAGATLTCVDLPPSFHHLPTSSFYTAFHHRWSQNGYICHSVCLPFGEGALLRLMRETAQRKKLIGILKASHPLRQGVVPCSLQLLLLGQLRRVRLHPCPSAPRPLGTEPANDPGDCTYTNHTSLDNHNKINILWGVHTNKLPRMKCSQAGPLSATIISSACHSAQLCGPPIAPTLASIIGATRMLLVNDRLGTRS